MRKVPECQFAALAGHPLILSLATRVYGISSHIKRRQSIYGIAVVVLVTVTAAVLTLQGWRSRIPTFDLVTDIYRIRDFLATGVLPQHADTNGYGAFSPPGSAWLMLPSALLFDDPRLSEYVGAGLLHFLTILGLFLLGRPYFGTWSGCWVGAV